MTIVFNGVRDSPKDRTRTRNNATSFSQLGGGASGGSGGSDEPAKGDGSGEPIASCEERAETEEEEEEEEKDEEAREKGEAAWLLGAYRPRWQQEERTWVWSGAQALGRRQRLLFGKVGRRACFSFAWR